MSAYGALAGRYDELTRDVAYEDFADYYESIFQSCGGEYNTILDLCCGTGSLSCALARRGYELISADASPDMLMVAREKAAALEGCVPPLIICQSAAELDLYGTVDAAVSSLESVGYLPQSDLPEVFRRLCLFVRPGGLLIFDIRTPEFLRAMDGQVNVDETDDVLCLWRGRFDEEREALLYGLDLFERSGDTWLRSFEEHVEYAHLPERVKNELERAGFTDITIRADGPQGDAGRIFFIAKRK